MNDLTEINCEDYCPFFGKFVMKPYDSYFETWYPKALRELIYETELEYIKNVIVGFENHGNTCYLNALLQCLYHTPAFKDYIINSIGLFDHTGLPNHIVDLFKNLSIREMTSVRVSLYEIIKDMNSHFKKTEKDRDFAQQDSDFAYRHIYNSIKEHLESNYTKKSKEYHEFDDLFGCDEELSIVSRDQTTLYSQTPHRREFSIIDYMGDFDCDIESYLNDINIEERVDDYKTEEELERIEKEIKSLSDENPGVKFGIKDVEKKTGIFYTKVLKKKKLIKFRKELSVFYKRGKEDFDTGEFYKLSAKINFKDIMQVGETKFKLHGIVIHKGTLDGGHYYSYNLVGNQWYIMNDNAVYKVKPEDVFSDDNRKNAILFFYTRLDQ
jgi:ubiquitin C-terminal hydrolase